MGPLTDIDQQVARSAQVKKYAQVVDRESARELLAAKVVPQNQQPPAQQDRSPQGYTPQAQAPAKRGSAKEPPSTFDQIMKSPVTRTVAGAITRGLMGALLGSPRRSTRSRW
jgi:hypothetical protein